MENCLWDKDEFEEYVTKAIVGLNEPTHRLYKKTNPAVKPSKKEMSRMKKIGPYFPPHDRIFHSDRVDVKNDFIPNHVALALGCVEQEDKTDLKRNDKGLMDGYLRILWGFKSKLPKKWQKTGPGTPYFVCNAFAREEGGLMFVRDFVTIDPTTGFIYPVEYIDQWYDGYRHQTHMHMSDKNKDGGYTSVVTASAAISAWCDKRFLWNVDAAEGSAKASFGVYPEQIQSLFYARDLPKTKTGRKNPILHWVSAHKRRVKNGTEINIENHLRGTDKFEMNGTLFTITRPQKPNVNS